MRVLSPPPATATRYVMGTFLKVGVNGTDPRTVQPTLKILFDEIQNLEELLSIYRPASEISRINREAGITPVPVSRDTYDVITRAISFAKDSSGAFDPTVWSQGDRAHFQDVVLDPEDQSVFLSKPGMSLDLGGIGKGFAMDRALLRVQDDISLEKIHMNFGGQLLFWTRAGHFVPEKVAIEDPRNQDKELDSFYVQVNCSVATSSNAERPGHLIDPRSGRPAELAENVTVVAPTATQAECFSTALFVMSAEEAAAFLKQHPDVKAYIQRRSPIREAFSN